MGQENNNSFTAAQKRSTGAGDLPITSNSGESSGRSRLFPRGRAQIQKTFNNIKITILCGFVTILVLRGTIGVGTFSKSDSLRIAQETARVLAEIRSDDDDSVAEDLEFRFNWTLGPPVKNWDELRRGWVESNPEFPRRTFLVTGSPPRPCENPIGDHYLLKSAKNKMDYCRIHGMEMVYNVAHLERELSGYWAKLPLLRRIMVSHPEAEWVWWMDSDALFTDMSFTVPSEKYKGYDLIVHGYPDLMFQHRSWVALNTGSFLIRNSQWSLDLLDAWAPMGPKGPIREEAGRILTRALKGRPDFEADDQSALIYLLLSDKERWMGKVFLENSYYLHGYWAGLVDSFDDDTARPFVTHFVGCKPCGSYGDYPVERCIAGLERAFNFADNQILELYGFAHRGLLSPKVRRIRNDTSTPLEIVDRFDIRHKVQASHVL